jgi:hypothetical protein
MTQNSVKFFMLGCALVLTGAAFADPSCEALNERWQNKYVSDFGVSWQTSTFQCPSTASHIAEAFYALDHTTFRGNAPGFYTWTAQQIQRTSFQDDGGIADAQSGSGLLTLFGAFANEDLNWRTATLVHEARHDQSDDPAHVTCWHGDRKDTAGACDQDFYNGNWGGSGYNYGFIFHWWVRDAAEVTDLDHDVAAADAKFLLLNRFNTITNDQVQKFDN